MDCRGLGSGVRNRPLAYQRANPASSNASMISFIFLEAEKIRKRWFHPKANRKILRIPLMLFMRRDSNEDISGAPNCFNEGGLFEIIAQFLAQTAHDDIHGAVEIIGFDPFQFIQNLITVENSTRISRQISLSSEFGSGDDIFEFRSEMLVIRQF